MHKINLANNKTDQNLEIIYNDKNVYFKTLRTIHKNEYLTAFPSKDLEISLGLQFIPISSTNVYSCRKCQQSFKFQYHIMLHNRYFCSLTPNNYLKTLILNNNNNINSTCKKRKLTDFDNHDNNYLTSEIEERVVTMPTLVEKYLPIKDKSKLNTLNNNLLKSIVDRLNSYSQQINNEQTMISKQNNKNNASKQSTLTSPSSSLISNTNQLNQIINTQTLQNWCAKCNTHFRLTTDLVFHMRTYHRTNRKEDILTNISPTTTTTTNTTNNSTTTNLSLSDSIDALSLPSSVTPTSINKLNKTMLINDQDRLNNSLKSKFLKCDICLEIFREKHHLSRHMTSHR